MIRNDTTWVEAIRGLERTIKTKITSKHHNYTYEDELSNVSFGQIGTSSDCILFGETCSNKLTFKLYSEDSYKPIDGDILTVTQYINDSLSVQVGKFRIEEIEDDDNSNYYDITAYDCIYGIINGNITIDLSSSSTGSDVLTGINSYLQLIYGVSFSSEDISKASAITFTDIEEGTYNVSEVLPKVLQFIGYNVRSNNQGVPEFYWFNDVDYTITRDDQLMNGFTRKSEQLICVDSITVKVDDETSYTVNRSSNPTGDYNHISLSFENKYFTQSQLNSLQSRMDVLVYQPCSVKFRGNPAIEIGDIVKVERKDGTTVKAIACQIDTVLTGMSATLECKGSSEKSSGSGSLSNEVESISNELHFDYINAKEIDAGYAHIDLANIDEANIIKFYATAGVIESLNAGVITTEKANALLADIGNAKVQNEVAQLILASSLVANEGVINTITGSQLKLSDSNGNQIQLDGATQKFYDKNGKLRVAIGNNGTDGYSMWILDTSGNVLFNPTGVTYNGLLSTDVANVLNNDGKNTTINASKLNITSLVNTLNDDGTNHLKASAIIYDETNQTMDVLYSNLKSDNTALQSSYKMSNGLLDYLVTQVNTTALTSKPNDWDTAYYKYYYKGNDNQFYHLQDKVTFESGKYYAPSNSVSNLKMNSNGISLIGSAINISGKVSFSDLSTSGNTNINGDNITTGTIKSNDFTGIDSSTGYTTGGVVFNLNRGYLKSKSFQLNTDGSAKFKGDIVGGTINIGTDYGSENITFPIFSIDDDGTARFIKIYTGEYDEENDWDILEFKSGLMVAKDYRGVSESTTSIPTGTPYRRNVFCSTGMEIYNKNYSDPIGRYEPNVIDLQINGCTRDIKVDCDSDEYFRIYNHGDENFNESYIEIHPNASESYCRTDSYENTITISTEEYNHRSPKIQITRKGSKTNSIGLVANRSDTDRYIGLFDYTNETWILYKNLSDTDRRIYLKGNDSTAMAVWYLATGSIEIKIGALAKDSATSNTTVTVTGITTLFSISGYKLTGGYTTYGNVCTLKVVSGTQIEYNVRNLSTTNAFASTSKLIVYYTYKVYY